jgi:glycosyltransferase involved in cell wall biosynthesis
LDSPLPTPPLKLPTPEVSLPQVSRPEVSIIVPARNEEASLGDCLESLTAQSGLTFEIIVVDDASTDRTREIAQSFAGVRVISAGPLPAGWTGKNSAVVAGTREAGGRWFLFTDADTVHQLGSLARALAEARANKAEMLSYSPEQIAVTFWEIAVLPVVFAELARQYPPQRVCDPASPIAAANGQYILIRRETYDAVGGHTAIADNLLEDVALARAVKGAGRSIRFRYAADAVRTRMYRSFRQLREGWTKNLALLFPNPGWLAMRLLLWWGIAWGFAFFPVIALTASKVAGHFGFVSAEQTFFHWSGLIRSAWWSPLFLVLAMPLFMRLNRANFTWDMEVLGAVFGMPMFSYLLLRSRKAHANGQVPWKSRAYSVGAPSGSPPSETQAAGTIARIENQGLRAKS